MSLNAPTTTRAVLFGFAAGLLGLLTGLLVYHLYLDHLLLDQIRGNLQRQAAQPSQPSQPVQPSAAKE